MTPTLAASTTTAIAAAATAVAFAAAVTAVAFAAAVTAVAFAAAATAVANAATAATNHQAVADLQFTSFSSFFLFLFRRLTVNHGNGRPTYRAATCKT